jgi:hypothetical protein
MYPVETPDPIVKEEGSPVLGLGPDRAALVHEEFPEVAVREDMLRLEDEGSSQ